MVLLLSNSKKYKKTLMDNISFDPVPLVFGVVWV